MPDYYKDAKAHDSVLPYHQVIKTGLEEGAYNFQPKQKPAYKFNEENVLSEVLEYINSTYGGHYAKGRNTIQVTEFTLSHCKEPQDALKFNVIKYAARYGKKKGYNKEDLLKSIHYLVMMLYTHDELYIEKSEV